VRIAVINHAWRKAGGAESYIGSVLPVLAGAGHALGFWHEWEGPPDRSPIPLPGGTPRWSAADLGADAAVAALREWRPEVLFSHGLLTPGLEAALQSVAPGVLLAHNYYGTCISGGKAFQFPSVRPCERQFGAACLLQFYPRRCGGLNPRTMWRMFRTQRDRLNLLPRYRALVTFSEHVRGEYIRHGLAADRVFHITPCIDDEPESEPDESMSLPPPVWRLLFCGRMDRLKGVQVLLHALADVSPSLGRRVHLTLAGDGPERTALEKLAAALLPRTSTEFLGWVPREQLRAVFRATHLLVVPSLWPEPFGLVGPEAGRHAVPAAAFAVGGIPDWLRDGVNGHLAPGDPPRAQGLAGAIRRCLQDPLGYARLRRGARAEVDKYRPENHVRELVPILQGAADGTLPGGPASGECGREKAAPCAD